MFYSKKILVTGGAGFIGSRLVDRLIKDGYKVIVVDNLSVGQKKNLKKEASFYNIDICDSEINRIFEKEKPDFVFHLAAQIDVRKSVEDPFLDNKINVLGTLNILKNCRKYNVKKIVFISTGGAIYGEAKIIPTPENYPENPLSPYGINKLTAEKYLNYYYKIFGLPYISLRLANVYGPGQNPDGEVGVIAVFCAKMLKKEENIIVSGDGKQTRDFIFVDDVVNACLCAMNSSKIGIFNIGTSKEISINALFEELKKITGSKCEKKHKPQKAGEQEKSCLDISKAKKEFNWQPKYSLNQGLIKTVASQAKLL